MTRRVLSVASTYLAACTILSMLAGRSLTADRPSNPTVRPNPVGTGAQPPADAAGTYVSKESIELPTKTVIATQSAATPAGTPANPRIEPGKVRWHSDFSAACAAARESGRAVLLFQMMGKLDEQFC